MTTFRNTTVSSYFSQMGLIARTQFKDQREKNQKIRRICHRWRPLKNSTRQFGQLIQTENMFLLKILIVECKKYLRRTDIIFVTQNVSAIIKFPIINSLCCLSLYTLLYTVQLPWQQTRWGLIINVLMICLNINFSLKGYNLFNVKIFSA